MKISIIIPLVVITITSVWSAETYFEREEREAREREIVESLSRTMHGQDLYACNVAACDVEFDAGANTCMIGRTAPNVNARHAAAKKKCYDQGYKDYMKSGILTRKGAEKDMDADIQENHYIATKRQEVQNWMNSTRWTKGEPEAIRMPHISEKEIQRRCETRIPPKQDWMKKTPTEPYTKEACEGAARQCWNNWDNCAHYLKED
jgi:hypothetical protein